MKTVSFIHTLKPKELFGQPSAGNWQAGVVVNFTSGFGSALRLGFRSVSRNTVPVGPSEPVRRGEIVVTSMYSRIR